MVDMASMAPEGLMAIGAGLAVGLSALASGWSQSAIGSAAIGAAAERPEMQGNVLIWMVIPETLVLFGFIIAYFIVQAIGGGGH